jgi:hypothetical protein
MRAFWTQPLAAYRNFQIVFTLLTLNFLVPAITYVFAPHLVVEQFRGFGALLGGIAYPLDEKSHLWRGLGASNVATLGLMCLLLQLNVRRFHAVLVPLVFMKGMMALFMLGCFFTVLPYRGFLAVSCWDALAVVLFLAFAPRARRALDENPGVPVVPALRFAG